MSIHLSSLISEIQSNIALLTSTRAAHNLIDECFEELRKTTIRLRSIRNERAAVAKLPTEILSTILCLAINPQGDAENTYSTSKPSSWSSHVQLTLVCSHWRLVALHCPEYWSRIPFSPGKHYEQMLTRAGESPRVFAATYPFASGSDGSTSVPDLVTRQLTGVNLAGLHLHLIAAPLSAVLSHFPRATSPLLSHISIEGDRFKGPGTPTLPFHMFACSMPALRHLHLADCAIPWHDIQDRAECQFPANLLSLRIHSPQYPCPATLLLSILELSPNLNHLYLKAALDPDFIPRTEQPISMHSLKTLSVDDGGAFVPFYASCTWPYTMDSTVKLGLLKGGDLEQVLATCHSTDLNNRFDDMSLAIFEGVELRGPGIEWSVRSMQGYQSSVGLVDEVLKDLHLAVLTRLKIDEPTHFRMLPSDNDDNTELTIPHWASFVSRHEHVGTLILRGFQLFHVLDDLYAAPANNNSGGPNPSIHFPSLAHLILENTAVSQRDWTESLLHEGESVRAKRSFYFGKERVHDGYSTFCSLRKMLRSRHDAGIPIQQLTIREVRGFNEVATSVVEIAGEGVVHWDPDTCPPLWDPEPTEVSASD